MNEQDISDTELIKETLQISNTFAIVQIIAI